MLNLGTSELLVIVVVGLVVLGPAKLPDAARSVGRAMAEMRRLSSGFRDELDSARHDAPRSRAVEIAEQPVMPPTSRRPRRSQPLRANGHA